MFRKLLTLNIILLFALTCDANDTEKLLAYLKQHAVRLSYDVDSTLQLTPELSALLDNAINGKQLLIMGEGGSHSLNLNGDMMILLLRYAGSKNLKYFFVEGSRASAIRDNDFFNTPGINAQAFYKQYYPDNNTYFNRMKDAEKIVHQKSGFMQVGIDFERARGLYLTTTKATKDVTSAYREKLYQLAPYLKDTSYFAYSEKGFKNFFKEQQNNFYRDSNQFKSIENLNYPMFRYELSNSNINTSYGQRDRPMAENLLSELGGIQQGQLCLLDCGMAHSRPNINGTLANILSKSDVLKNKIEVVQIICDDCSTPQEKASNWAYKYLNDNILSTFNSAAGDNITIFDLSGVPKEFEEIKEYGRLLVFAHGYKN